MRFTRLVVFGLLAILSVASAVRADDSTPQPRNFGTTNCQQRFSCSNTDSAQLAEIANNCSVQGFGISAARTGIFDSASLDSNNCLMGELPAPNNGGHTMAPQCCITADGDNCSMRCTLLMY